MITTVPTPSEALVLSDKDLKFVEETVATLIQNLKNSPDGILCTIDEPYQGYWLKHPSRKKALVDHFHQSDWIAEVMPHSRTDKYVWIEILKPDHPKILARIAAEEDRVYQEALQRHPVYKILKILGYAIIIPFFLLFAIGSS